MGAEDLEKRTYQIVGSSITTWVLPDPRYLRNNRFSRSCSRRQGRGVARVSNPEEAGRCCGTYPNHSIKSSPEVVAHPTTRSAGRPMGPPPDGSSSRFAYRQATS